MTTAKEPGLSVSWEDLLAAINPPKRTPEELYDIALDEVTTAWEKGDLDDDEADNLIKELISARLGYEMGKMINFAFSPNVGRHAVKSRRRFSLL